MTPPIRTQGLTKRFGQLTAVDDLSFSVPEGSVCVLAGANGAGKSTTIRMLMNLIRPSSGSAAVLGVPARELTPADWQKIGYVSESRSLPGRMTVNELMEFSKAVYPKWDSDLAAQLRRDLQLPLHQSLGTFSRGDKMKAALLCSLAYRPRLLVLDEPFAGLHPLVRWELIEGLLETCETEGWTVLLSSHEIEAVEDLADRIVLLNEGQLVFQESVAAIRRRFATVSVLLSRCGGRPSVRPSSWLNLESSGCRFSFVARN